VIATLLLAVPICTAQALQKGISVDLPVTSSAVSIPDADREGALIVSITEDGSIYFGTNPISPSALKETVKSRLSNQTEKTLYLKADVDVPYASLVKVLDSAFAAGVNGLTLLTTQRRSEKPGTVIAPTGLQMQFVQPQESSRTELR